MSEYFTTGDVANEFGVTETTIREWLRDGELIGIKIGSTWRVKESDLKRYLEGQRVKVLLERAKKKQPDVDWQEEQCAECGEAIVVVVRQTGTWVCSPECKQKYDKALLRIAGDEGIPSTVVPRI